MTTREESADDFIRLATEFRSISADNPATAAKLMHRVAADAMKLLKRAGDAGYLQVDVKIPWPSPMHMLDDTTDRWAGLWSVNCWQLGNTHHFELPTNPEAFETRLDAFGKLEFMPGGPQDWPVVSKNYAAVCDWLAARITASGKRLVDSSIELSKSELCVILGCSLDTLSRDIARGTLRASEGRTSKRLLVVENDLPDGWRKILNTSKGEK